MTTSTTNDLSPETKFDATISPLHERILAQRLAEKDRTSDGLFISDGGPSRRAAA